MNYRYKVLLKNHAAVSTHFNSLMQACKFFKNIRSSRSSEFSENAPTGSLYWREHNLILVSLDQDGKFVIPDLTEEVKELVADYKHSALFAKEQYIRTSNEYDGSAHYWAYAVEHKQRQAEFLPAQVTWEIEEVKKWLM